MGIWKRGSSIALAMAMGGSTLAGCATDTKGPEENAPTDGKFDTFFQPTVHGYVPTNVTVGASLDAHTQFHAWDLVLGRATNVSFETSGPNSDLDTVLYLYQQGEGGWGSYIAKNDDHDPGTQYSRIEERLEPGTYRLLVKGYHHSVQGFFNLRVDGESEPVPSNFCLFGDTVGDHVLSNNVEVVGAQRSFDASNANELTEVQQQQVLQVFGRYLEGTPSAEDALEETDDSEALFYRLRDYHTGQLFDVWRSYLGDNMVGRIFISDSTEQVADISDGDISNCRLSEPEGRYEGISVEPADVGADVGAFAPNAKSFFVRGLRPNTALSTRALDRLFEVLHATGEFGCLHLPTGVEWGHEDVLGPFRYYGNDELAYELESSRDEDWYERLTVEQIDAARAYTDARDDTDAFQVWHGKRWGEACGGTGGWRYYLMHDVASAQIWVFSLYEYDE